MYRGLSGFGKGVAPAPTAGIAPYAGKAPYAGIAPTAAIAPTAGFAPTTGVAPMAGACSTMYGPVANVCQSTVPVVQQVPVTSYVPVTSVTPVPSNVAPQTYVGAPATAAPYGKGAMAPWGKGMAPWGAATVAAFPAPGAYNVEAASVI